MLHVVLILLFCNFKLVHSCLAMRGSGGGDIPVLACATCPQVAVSTGSGVEVDEPITQSVTTLPNGCRNVAVTCTSRTAGTEVNLFFSNNGVDLGTATATTTITRNLVCNSNGQLQLTENGVTREIDEIECISAAPACTTCTNPTLVTGSGIGVNRPVMQTRGTDTNGCATVAISCTTPTAGDDIFFFWMNDGADRGTSQGITTVSRTLTCDANGEFILTEGPDMGPVDSVECITAT